MLAVLLGVTYFPFFLIFILLAELISVCFCSYGLAWFFLITAAIITGSILLHTGMAVSFNTEDALMYLGLYILAGVVWSFVKWIHQMHRIKWKMQDVFKESSDVEHHVEEYNNLSRNRKIEINIPSAYSTKGYGASGSSANHITRLNGVWADYFPKVRQNKATISNWITFWPFSFVATFIQDFIIDLVDNLVEFFKNIYDYVGKAILSSTFK